MTTVRSGGESSPCGWCGLPERGDGGGSCKVWPSVPAQDDQECERQEGESGVSRGRAVGAGAAHEKLLAVAEAEGKSHKDVRGEELADDRSSGSHSGKARGGRAQDAVQGLLELRWTSPTPGHVLALSSRTLQPSLCSLSVHQCTFLLFLCGISESIILL